MPASCLELGQALRGNLYSSTFLPGITCCSAFHSCPCPASLASLPVYTEITSFKGVTCDWTLISRSASGTPDLRHQETFVEWMKGWYPNTCPREGQMKCDLWLTESCFKKFFFWSVHYFLFSYSCQHSYKNLGLSVNNLEDTRWCVYVLKCVYMATINGNVNK